jgi:hypothetical protein
MEQQLELPLEMPVYDHYQVELRHGEMPDLTVMRSNRASDVDGALNLIEGFMQMAVSRHGVTWKDDEIDPTGNLFGLAPGGEVWQVIVVPPLAYEVTNG